MRATGLKKVVIGISGGLDSTQALLVCAQAFDLLGLPRENILAYTMPGFATSDHTKSNAWRLMRALGVTASELDIKPAAKQMLSDLGHPYSAGESVYDITFENVQAGLRTDYLFRLANHLGGIVIGTGDLSELALGWCTYGVGDQMAHYNVNAGVPKTLIQHLIRWIIGTKRFADDVLARWTRSCRRKSRQSLSRQPRARPRRAPKPKSAPMRCRISRCSTSCATGSRRRRSRSWQQHAWEDPARGNWPPHFDDDRRIGYDLQQIRHWMEVFLTRFFAFSQFKRSAMPNGPKGPAGGSLSPRGDWRAPSDGNAAAWLAELERNVPIE